MEGQFLSKENILEQINNQIENEKTDKRSDFCKCLQRLCKNNFNSDLEKQHQIIIDLEYEINQKLRSFKISVNEYVQVQTQHKKIVDLHQKLHCDNKYEDFN